MGTFLRHSVVLYSYMTCGQFANYETKGYVDNNLFCTAIINLVYKYELISTSNNVINNVVNGVHNLHKLCV